MVKRKKITLLLAEDQTLFRDGVKDLLEDEKWIEVVGEAANGEEAVQLAKKLKPNVILMDIKLPKLTGIEATRKIRKQNKDIKILMLSSFEDESHIMEAISAGANGYLSKMLAAKEVVNSLRAFVDEGVMIPPRLMGKLITTLQNANLPNISSSSPAALTPSEIKIINLLGRGKSNGEIAKAIDSSVKTIKNHLNTIFQKLDVSNRTEAVVKAIDKGIISAEETEFEEEK